MRTELISILKSDANESILPHISSFSESSIDCKARKSMELAAPVASPGGGGSSVNWGALLRPTRVDSGFGFTEDIGELKAQN